MDVLLANIGTSDLAVKIGDYFFPVGFDRKEPNIDFSNLTEEESRAWEDRIDHFGAFLADELGVLSKKGNFVFRDLTCKLLEAYRKKPEDWHHRIRPGRLWGVLNTPEFKLEKAVLFFTDQRAIPGGHRDETLYLFQIIQEWLSREGCSISIFGEEIPFPLSAVDLDGLFDFYFNFIQGSVPQDSTLIISVKGGTPQMQNALRTQAVLAGPPKSIFLEPLLSIKSVLLGEVSGCRNVSYSLYVRNHKFRDALLLLKGRRDFDGARSILTDWRKEFISFAKDHATDRKEILEKSDSAVEKAIELLVLANALLDFDYKKVKTMPAILIDKYVPEYASSIQATDSRCKMLNLYSQCRLFWQLDKMAHMLERLSMFFDAALECLIENAAYIEKRSSIWVIKHDVLLANIQGRACWKNFVDSQKKNKKREGDCGTWKLKDKPEKLDFIEYVHIPLSTNDNGTMTTILNDLKKIRYYVSLRNALVHKGEGISKDVLKKRLVYDRENKSLLKQAALQASNPKGILSAMRDGLQALLGSEPVDLFKRIASKVEGLLNASA
jgi:hypothetical protein